MRSLDPVKEQVFEKWYLYFCIHGNKKYSSTLLRFEVMSLKLEIRCQPRLSCRRGSYRPDIAGCIPRTSLARKITQVMAELCVAQFNLICLPTSKQLGMWSANKI